MPSASSGSATPTSGLPDGGRDALRLRAGQGHGGGDHGADDRPRLPPLGRGRRRARPVRALRREPRGAQRGDAHAPRRRPRDRRCDLRRPRAAHSRAALVGGGGGARRAPWLPQRPGHRAGAHGHDLVPDGLRHDRRGARLLAGQVQGAGGRRADDDRQPHGPAGAADARLLRAADRADRGAPRRARHDRRRPGPEGEAPAGVRRGRRRARDLAHGPPEDDGRRAAVHLGGDLEDRQPAAQRDRRGHPGRLHRGVAARDQGAGDLPRRLEDRPGAAHRRAAGRAGRQGRRRSDALRAGCR